MGLLSPQLTTGTRQAWQRRQGFYRYLSVAALPCSLITKHKRYKELADYDKKNAFDVEKYLNHNLTFSKDTEFEMFRIDVTEDEIRQIEIIN